MLQSAKHVMMLILIFSTLDYQERLCLIIAGIHGDEPSGTKALMNMINHGDDIMLTHGRLIIIPYANWCGWLTEDIELVPAKGRN